MHSPIIHYTSKDSRQSDDSQDSHSTAPTSLYSSAGLSLLPPSERIVYAKPYDVSPATTYYPRSSTETYLSGASEENLCEEPEEYDHEYDVPELRVRRRVDHDLRPSTPQDFAELFSQAKRLYIRHDDTTYDGNMNLRVDTEDPLGKPHPNIQLFHMRMHDLKKREFSIRRYERASGREICHSNRKYKSWTDGKPSITRSMTHALASITGAGKFKRTNSGISTHSVESSKAVRRQDSGYGSSQEDEDNGEAAKPASQVPTNTIKLEFSNYAVVEIRRRGAKSSKRYEFEYWGHMYSWKRVTEQDGESKAVSYHLHRDDGHVVAHIVPEMRTPVQIRVDAIAGGWVPPCSMWVSDHSILEAPTDVADVIVATGLISLTDDCIKAHFHPEAASHHHQVHVPLTPLKIDLAGPMAMAEHVFKRRGSASSNKEKEHRGSPLKFESPVLPSYATTS